MPYQGKNLSVQPARSLCFYVKPIPTFGSEVISQPPVCEQEGAQGVALSNHQWWFHSKGKKMALIL